MSQPFDKVLCRVSTHAILFDQQCCVPMLLIVMFCRDNNRAITRWILDQLKDRDYHIDILCGSGSKRKGDGFLVHPLSSIITQSLYDIRCGTSAVVNAEEDCASPLLEILGEGNTEVRCLCTGILSRNERESVCLSPTLSQHLLQSISATKENTYIAISALSPSRTYLRLRIHLLFLYSCVFRR